MTAAPVLFEVQAGANGLGVGVATLNAEKSLNSLSLPMIDLLHAQLVAWQDDRQIVAVVLQGAGERAFCAGGDIQALYRSMREHPDGDNPYARAFFEREYRLDYLIHRYDKPVISWGHGFAMGGGLGLMVASSHRIGTAQTRLSMPEITIGLFPDAGATWMLANMPAHWAHFLAWTGCQFVARDAREFGVVDYLVKHEDKAALMAGLFAVPWSSDPGTNHQLLGDLIRGFEGSADEFPVGQVEAHDEAVAALIDDCLATTNPAAAFGKGLEQLDQSDPWIARASAAFRSGCPTTALIVPRQIEQARGKSLKQMLMMELNIALQCARHPDFVEGVRALLIDRDNKPAWHFSSVDGVPVEWIDEHFVLPLAGEHPLTDLPD